MRNNFGDAAIELRLTDLNNEEVVPALESHGMAEAEIAYGATTRCTRDFTAVSRILYQQQC